MLSAADCAGAGVSVFKFSAFPPEINDFSTAISVAIFLLRNHVQKVLGAMREGQAHAAPRFVLCPVVKEGSFACAVVGRLEQTPSFKHTENKSASAFVAHDPLEIVPVAKRTSLGYFFFGLIAFRFCGEVNWIAHGGKRRGEKLLYAYLGLWVGVEKLGGVFDGALRLDAEVGNLQAHADIRAVTVFSLNVLG